MIAMRRCDKLFSVGLQRFQMSGAKAFEALSLRHGRVMKKSDIWFSIRISTSPLGTALILYVGNIVPRIYSMTEDL